MGRSIPSFRQLIDIERMNWSEFRKELSSKSNKKAFDLIFENAKLYTYIYLMLVILSHWILSLWERFFITISYYLHYITKKEKRLLTVI